MAEVSILVNCKNGSKYLKNAIKSVLLQTFEDFEILFVDNCSCDNSIKIMEEFNDERIRIISTKKEMTLGEARDHGMKFINANYLCFLDVDDRIHKNRLRDQIAIMKKGDFGFSYGSCNLINSSERVIGKIKTEHAEGDLLDKLLIDGKVPFCTAMVDVQKNQGELYFNKKFKYSPDIEFLSRILIKSKSIGISNLFTNYMVRNDSLSAETIKYAYSERLILIRDLGHKFDEKLLLIYKTKVKKTIILSSILNKELSVRKLISILKKEKYKKRMILCFALFHSLPFVLKNRLINVLKFKLPLLYFFRF